MPHVLDRELARVRTLPAPHTGQFGPDHTVIEVITPDQWADADPFILLMDDRVDGRLMAGPHPHAGFETVTFVVRGDFAAENASGARLGEGDVEWTTAGSGIVHGPSEPVVGTMRILQLWLTLPKAERWTTPDDQIVARAKVPVRRDDGVVAHVFSGRSGEAVSPTRNHVPVTLVDLQLEPGASMQQEVPASHNGFLYLLEGEARVGTKRTSLAVGQVGWLDRPSEPADGRLRLANEGTVPARVLVYLGARQNVPIVQHGPFVGDTREDIVRSYERFRQGTYRRV